MGGALVLQGCKLYLCVLALVGKLRAIVESSFPTPHGVFVVVWISLLSAKSFERGLLVRGQAAALLGVLHEPRKQRTPKSILKSMEMQGRPSTAELISIHR